MLLLDGGKSAMQQFTVVGILCCLYLANCLVAAGSHN